MHERNKKAKLRNPLTIENTSIIKSGYLLKDPPPSNLPTRQRRRYFVLARQTCQGFADNTTLSYFKDEKAAWSKSPLGMVELDPFDGMQVTYNGANKTSFRVRDMGTGRSYILYAQSAEESVGWVTAMQSETEDEKKIAPHRLTLSAYTQRKQLSIIKRQTMADTPSMLALVLESSMESTGSTASSSASTTSGASRASDASMEDKIASHDAATTSTTSHDASTEFNTDKIASLTSSTDRSAFLASNADALARLASNANAAMIAALASNAISLASCTIPEVYDGITSGGCWGSWECGSVDDSDDGDDEEDNDSDNIQQTNQELQRSSVSPIEERKRDTPSSSSSYERAYNCSNEGSLEEDTFLEELQRASLSSSEERKQDIQEDNRERQRAYRCSVEEWIQAVPSRISSTSSDDQQLDEQLGQPRIVKQKKTNRHSGANNASANNTTGINPTASNIEIDTTNSTNNRVNNIANDKQQSPVYENAFLSDMFAFDINSAEAWPTVDKAMTGARDDSTNNDTGTTMGQVKSVGNTQAMYERIYVCGTLDRKSLTPTQSTPSAQRHEPVLSAEYETSDLVARFCPLFSTTDLELGENEVFLPLEASGHTILQSQLKPQSLGCKIDKNVDMLDRCIRLQDFNEELLGDFEAYLKDYRPVVERKNRLVHQ